jgi:hypothetical protein
LLHLSPRRAPNQMQSNDVLTTAAKRLGRDVLSEARTRAPKERLDILDQAIGDSAAVHPSPIARPQQLRTAAAPTISHEPSDASRR